MRENKTGLEIDHEILKLAERIRGLARTKTGKIGRIPDDILKESVLLWEQSKLSQCEFGKRIGIGDSAFGYWKKLCDERNRSKTNSSKKAEQGFDAVKMKPEIKGKQEISGLRLELKSGVCVTGLRLEDVVKLVREAGL